MLLAHSKSVGRRNANLNGHGLYSYGLYSYGLCSYGLYSGQLCVFSSVQERAHLSAHMPMYKTAHMCNASSHTCLHRCLHTYLHTRLHMSTYMSTHTARARPMLLDDYAPMRVPTGSEGRCLGRCGRAFRQAISGHTAATTRPQSDVLAYGTCRCHARRAWQRRPGPRLCPPPRARAGPSMGVFLRP